MTAIAGSGMALGIAVSILVTCPLAAFLVEGLSVHDPISDGATAFALGVVALIAGWLPARRASRVDPMGVLRRD